MADKAKPAKAPPAEGAPEGAKKGGKKKLIILLAIPLLLGGVGAGLWFSGILPGLLGMHPPVEAAAPAATDVAVAPPPAPPVFLDMPDITANLNAPGRRAPLVRIRSRLELARAEDSAIMTAAMPRLLDLYATYLREMRPEELRGSLGTHRLREELIARANLVAAPARVVDVLFVEIIVQ
ncbi:flagellar basal body-associated FliL family protein [Humitalea sp. 24SJ18S-53]|uniref:flagellar basal body-associated FliL family protein n=1 Tax=Humitalea sp. 24SJ18S-53 TaxID=3422307 RepID=UPI003D67F78D